jgi:hypothetical protein
MICMAPFSSKHPRRPAFPHLTMPAKKKPKPAQPASDWRTTDQDEILRRIQRARDEKHSISNLHPERPVFSTFAVKSPSGMVYQVEIRDPKDCSFSCTCLDFRTAGLGTCKHTEATLIWLKRRFKGEFRAAETSGSPHIDIVPAATPCASSTTPANFLPRSNHSSVPMAT